ncbi:MAG: hypothetical protein ABIK44_06050 [candidate division WOR-3 bacterium]
MKSVRLLVLLALVSCHPPAALRPPDSVVSIVPLENLTLARPVVDIGVDNERLLLLEDSGTRILAISQLLVPVETIPLTTRLISPLGVAADRFYFYVFDRNTLYRISKEKRVLSVWLNNIRVAGLASYAPGEMLVSDGMRSVVWHKTLFGESRVFLDGRDVTRPGALVNLPDGMFGIVSAGNRLVCVNRAGITVRSLSLPAGTDLIVADGAGGIWTGQRGKPFVYRIGQRGQTAYELVDCTSPISFAIIGQRLFVLDSGTKIVSYSLPGH